ncbi:hypothetical protein p2A76 (plasmid) [Aromatoleum aromaticum EbN1]|uniref:Uncharacterized protein n=1 Tax=Aromatoleum aromaticum (strain DSM 19018 / LMG 30748 / EbN1) TaxID=76114 RepID=Q5NWJ6_AROAE|nr:hypothetical protein p2A76 [Aromatoleum aromaticum EbN1]
MALREATQISRRVSGLSPGSDAGAARQRSTRLPASVPRPPCRGELVAARQQDHHFQAALREIHGLAWPIMDSHLRDPLSHRFAVTKVAQLCPADSQLNARCRLRVSEIGKPGVERFGGLERSGSRIRPSLLSSMGAARGSCGRPRATPRNIGRGRVLFRQRT